MAVPPPGQESITAWTLFSAFGGSIIGATMGGIINYILQRAARAEAKKQKNIDRKEARTVLAYSFLFKMIKIVSGLKHLRTVVHGCLGEAQKRGYQGAAWKVVLPIANKPEPVKFTAEEMGMVLSLDDKIFNAVAAFDQLHNSTADIFEHYAVRRTNIMEKFGAQMDGNMGTSFLNDQEKMWLAPREVELNDLVEAMLQRTDQDYSETVDGLKAIHGLFVKEFNIKKTLEFI
jgi:hypothetical protein